MRWPEALSAYVSASIGNVRRSRSEPAMRDAMVAQGYIAEGYGPDAVAFCAE